MIFSIFALIIQFFFFSYGVADVLVVVARCCQVLLLLGYLVFRLQIFVLPHDEEGTLHNISPGLVCVCVEVEGCLRVYKNGVGEGVSLSVGRRAGCLTGGALLHTWSIMSIVIIVRHALLLMLPATLLGIKVQLQRGSIYGQPGGLYFRDNVVLTKTGCSASIGMSISGAGGKHCLSVGITDGLITSGKITSNWMISLPFSMGFL